MTSPVKTILKAGAMTKPQALAGAISGQIKDNGEATIQVIGCAALNQAIKAIAIARGHASGNGSDLATFPELQDIQEQHGAGIVTAVILRCELIEPA